MSSKNSRNIEREGEREIYERKENRN